MLFDLIEFVLIVALVYIAIKSSRELKKEKKYTQLYKEALEKERESKQEEIRRARLDSVKKSKSVINGTVLESVSPFLPDFPIDGDDIKFLGNPIDFIVFANTAEEGNCSINFVEVKTGNSRLSKKQKNIKTAIEEGRVFWYDYKINTNNLNQ